mmetsp:Transcript_43953/g.140855  ORF Transcript_43953/g.140855 Transcript_43953/m.140855 type:complete len:220 (+) Transcript_43953:44-703(+)
MARKASKRGHPRRSVAASGSARLLRSPGVRSCGAGGVRRFARGPLCASSCTGDIARTRRRPCIPAPSWHICRSPRKSGGGASSLGSGSPLADPRPSVAQAGEALEERPRPPKCRCSPRCTPNSHRHKRPPRSRRASASEQRRSPGASTWRSNPWTRHGPKSIPRNRALPWARSRTSTPRCSPSTARSSGCRCRCTPPLLGPSTPTIPPPGPARATASSR